MTLSPNDKLAREILVRAREIITPPKAWTKGAIARNSAGEELIRASSSYAHCFCSLGAIERAEHEFEIQGRTGVGMAGSAAVGALAAVTLQTHDTDFVSVFNDAPETEHVDVLAAFTLAISGFDIPTA